MNREDILVKATECVLGKRQDDYGVPEDNFSTIANFWNIYLVSKYNIESIISKEDIPILMSLLKIARMTKGNSIDNFVDLAGYAACAGEIISKNENV